MRPAYARPASTRALAALAMLLGAAACHSDPAGPTVQDPSGDWAGSYGTPGAGAAGTLALRVGSASATRVTVDGSTETWGVTYSPGHFLVSRAVMPGVVGYATAIECTLTSPRACEGVASFTAAAGSATVLPVRMTR